MSSFGVYARSPLPSRQAFGFLTEYISVPRAVAHETGDRRCHAAPRLISQSEWEGDQLSGSYTDSALRKRRCLNFVRRMVPHTLGYFPMFAAWTIMVVRQRSTAPGASGTRFTPDLSSAGAPGERKGRRGRHHRPTHSKLGRRHDLRHRRDREWPHAPPSTLHRAPDALPRVVCISPQFWSFTVANHVHLN